ncbi:response regulator [Paraglaciecola chathamensis]|uniref:histidine kinase n=1 Tax=Paraglaciecola chathamensis TaxID=368405 RepID=A0A8H9M4A8_9ALTE|nr:response regulator [Paraglaciecola oceanifecundans]GGZ62252.1 hypothetical protein GCM10011274_20270 [Paraglaciecola oceanifecundans]
MNIKRIVKRKIRRCYLVYATISITLLSLPWIYTYVTAQQRSSSHQFVQTTGHQSLIIRDITLNLYRFEHESDLEKKVAIKRQTIALMGLFNDNHVYLSHAELPRTLYQGTSKSLHDLFLGDSENIDSLSKAFFTHTQQVITSGLNQYRDELDIFPESYSLLVQYLSKAQEQFLLNEERVNQHMINVSILATLISLFVFAITIVALIYPIEHLLFRLIDKFSSNTKRTYRLSRDAGLDREIKSQFLSNMSHELRSPISGMFGMLELAQQEPETEKQKTYLLKAQKAGHQLLLLVDELLDISRIEAKVLTFEKVDFELIKVLDTVIAPITASAEKKGLTFSYDASSSLPKFVTGDPMRLAQALRNIVNNAVKFTDNGGVSVNVKLSIVDKQYLLDILINDSGIGIAPADHERVFNKFVQVSKGVNGSINGTGLGLTIAKEFAQGMGGSLTLNSAEGKGSTFKLSIPLGASKRNSATSRNNERVSSAKFAVIDDLETSRLYISHILQEDGFTVDVFDSATKFLLKKEEILDYAGLIIDIHMPGFNGYELAETIHAMFDTSAPPFIFISASPESINHTQLKFVDMWQGFAKPMDKNRFIDSIRVLSKKNILNSEAFEPAKVLLVEDEPINAEVVKTMLERHGHSVAVASTGAAAIHLATTENFNLILMDINLPDMSGIETTRSIKAQGVETEIVALTGNAYEEDKLKTREAGMTYHLVKPVMFHELNNVIKLALRVQTS